MKDILRSLMTLAVFACLVPSWAQAQVVVTYTNLASWSAAAGSSTLEDFSGATVGTSTANYGPTAFTGFTLSSISNGDEVGIANGAIGGGSTPPVPFNGQNFFGWGNGDGNDGPTTTLTFTQPVFAFGFDWFNTDTTDRYQITLNPSGQNFVSPPFDFNSQGFFGIVSDTPIDSVTISTLEFGGFVDTEGFDNVRVALAAVPEPTTWAMIGMVTLGTGAMTWRKRRQAMKNRFAKIK